MKPTSPHCNSCLKRRTVDWLFLLVVVLTFFGVGLTMAAGSKPQAKAAQASCQQMNADHAR